jgi:hypothetical protein
MQTCVGLLPGDLLAVGKLFVAGGLPVVCAELIGIGVVEIALLPIASDDIRQKTVKKRCISDSQ